MRDVLISLKPYYYYLIGEGIKKVEVRKSYPKAEDWSRNSWFYMSRDVNSFAKIPKEFQEKYRKHFGKVGMRFVCDTVHEFTKAFFDEQEPQDTEEIEFWLDQFKLPYNKLRSYVDSKEFFGWHITDLVVYDSPREISEFEKPCEEFEISFVCSTTITKVRGRPRFFDRPPQSWCYIEPRQTAD